MKRKFMLILGILAVALSALAFSGDNPQPKRSDCPLWGTPLCPEYPACCNK
jgi:hypothetical protein